MPTTRHHARRRRRGRLAIAVAAVVVLSAVGWVGDVVWNFIAKKPAVVTSCSAVGPSETYSMDPDQLLNASIIADVAMRRALPQRAVIVALATAKQESNLRNIDYGDADSLGLFQQRPSQGWGSPAQITDPVYAAGKFYDALLKVPDWQDLSVTKAASDVQHNAYPNAYADWEPRATALAGALMGTTNGELSCRLAQSGVLAMAAASASASASGAVSASDPPAANLASATAAVTAGLQGDLEVNHPDVVPVDSSHVSITVSGLQGLGSGDDSAAIHRTGTVASWAIAHAASDGITAVVIGDQEWRPDRDGWHAAAKPALDGSVVLTVGLRP